MTSWLGLRLTRAQRSDTAPVPRLAPTTHDVRKTKCPLRVKSRHSRAQSPLAGYSMRMEVDPGSCSTQCRTQEHARRVVPTGRRICALPGSIIRNQVSTNTGLCRGETQFCRAETKAPKRPLKSNRQPAETKCAHESPPIRGFSQRTGKSLFDGDCVVGLGGLELLTKRLLPRHE
jgi:hypothetical protein